MTSLTERRECRIILSKRKNDWLDNSKVSKIPEEEQCSKKEAAAMRPPSLFVQHERTLMGESPKCALIAGSV